MADIVQDLNRALIKAILSVMWERLLNEGEDALDENIVHKFIDLKEVEDSQDFLKDLQATIDAIEDSNMRNDLDLCMKCMCEVRNWIFHVHW